MLKILANGRVPNRPPQQRPVPREEPVSPELGRKLILEHQAQPGLRVAGHLNLSGATHLYHLPDHLTCSSLDISDCVNLTSLPLGLHVTHWIELAGSGMTGGACHLLERIEVVELSSPLR